MAKSNSLTMLDRGFAEFKKLLPEGLSTSDQFGAAPWITRTSRVMTEVWRYSPHVAVDPRVKPEDDESVWGVAKV